jgi:hypothetical protein
MDFQAARLAEGVDEVAERGWPANEVRPVHSHPFAMHAQVTAGEMGRDPFAALDAPARPPVPQP